MKKKSMCTPLALPFTTFVVETKKDLKCQTGLIQFTSYGATRKRSRGFTQVFDRFPKLMANKYGTILEGTNALGGIEHVRGDLLQLPTQSLPASDMKKTKHFSSLSGK